MIADCCHRSNEASLCLYYFLLQCMQKQWYVWPNKKNLKVGNSAISKSVKKCCFISVWIVNNFKHPHFTLVEVNFDTINDSL